MSLDQAVADRQAKAGAGGLLVTGAHAIEHVEHGVPRFRRDARSLVAHRHLHAPGFQPSSDLDRTAGWRVFCGVVQNVDQRLFDEDRIDVEDRNFLRDLHLDL